jgi:hypothetical protein
LGAGAGAGAGVAHPMTAIETAAMKTKNRFIKTPLELFPKSPSHIFSQPGRDDTEDNPRLQMIQVNPILTVDSPNVNKLFGFYAYL